MINEERHFPLKKSWPTKEFHYRKNIKVEGKETDMVECKDCHEFLPVTIYALMRTNKDGIYCTESRCRPCRKKYDHDQYIVVQNAPPAPLRCQCCHLIKKLEVDHIHGSTTFRGWLCRNCNSGMGKLGDNLEGVLQGAIYLENDKDKIIETLHKVFDEMFARKQ